MVNTNESWYQYPNRTDSESFLNLFGYVNNQVDGLLFPVILIITWFISFIGVFTATGGNKDAAARAFAFASFFNSILSIPLVIAGMLAAKIMYLFFILTAFGAFWLKLQSPTMD